MATKYRIPCSFLLFTVSLSAMSFAAIPYLGWAITGFPYQIQHVRVVLPEGSVRVMVSRVWEIHHLNPKNYVPH